MKTMSGVIHGRTIELFEDPGIVDGSKVEILLRPAKVQENPGDGLRRCAGALVAFWTEEDDRILAEIAEERQRTEYRETLDLLTCSTRTFARPFSIGPAGCIIASCNTAAD